MSSLELFCRVDDFYQQFLPDWQQPQLHSGVRKRTRLGRMHPSEIITLLILFHQSGYRTFKAFYLRHISVYLRAEFPGLLSSSRFVERVAATGGEARSAAAHERGSGATWPQNRQAEAE